MTFDKCADAKRRFRWSKKRGAELALGGLTLSILLAVLRRSELTQGLWLDECVSFWVAKDGPLDAIRRALGFQGQSPLYFLLLWGIRSTLGDGELALRLVSVLLVLGTGLLLFGWMSKRFSPQTGMVSLATFLFLPAVDQAFSARPYALALFLSTLSVILCDRWLNGRSRIAGVGCLVALVAAFYAHYFFLGIVLVHFSLLVTSELPRREIFRPSVFGVTAAAVFLGALIPGFFQLRELASHAQSLAFSNTPSWDGLWSTLAPPRLFRALAFSLVTGSLLDRRSSSAVPPGFYLVPAFSLWYAVPPSVFFAMSRFASFSIFVDRYFAWSLPGLALVVAIAVTGFSTSLARAVASIVFLCLLLVSVLSTSWAPEGWREASQVVNAVLRETPSAPVLAYSGLIEAESVEALLDVSKRAYLLAPFSRYPVFGDPIPLPSSFDGPARRNYLDAVIRPRLNGADRFVVIAFDQPIRRQSGEESGDAMVSDYFQKTFSSMGYRPLRSNISGQVAVILFKK
jgi:uncharacterized membrane protein